MWAFLKKLPFNPQKPALHHVSVSGFGWLRSPALGYPSRMVMNYFTYPGTNVRFVNKINKQTNKLKSEYFYNFFREHGNVYNLGLRVLQRELRINEFGDSCSKQLSMSTILNPEWVPPPKPSRQNITNVWGHLRWVSLALMRWKLGILLNIL